MNKLAITAMDCIIPGCQGLDAFERSIYEGIQHSISQEVPEFSSPQLLVKQVVENSLKNANFASDTKVGLIIITTTDIVAKSIGDISPHLAFTVAEKSFISALNLAEKLLVSQQVDAVILVGMDSNQSGNIISPVIHRLSYDKNAATNSVSLGVAAIVLQLHHLATSKNNRIYAIIEAISRVNSSQFSPEAISQVCHQAFQLAGVKARDIGYLEVFASGVPATDETEISGLLSAYQTGDSNLSCAIGSVKANIGHTPAASGIFSLIKTVLCLYYRYIPAVPQWSSPKTPELWRGSPFYVATESRPWFLEPGAEKRIAAMNLIEAEGKYIHLILSEEPSQERESNRYLAQMPFCLLAIAGDDRSSLIAQLQQLKADSSSISHIAHKCFQSWQTSTELKYAIALLGRNREELSTEIDRAIQGINIAFDTGKEWQTPLGSYFTPQPLGKASQVAFVYPGSFTSYVGLGRNLFRIFPQVYDDVLIRTVYERVANIEKLLYPRSLHKLSKRELEVIEQQFIDNPVAMLESEVGFAGLMTAILKNYFQIKSDSAFGYSLGETSMMVAQGVWTSFKDTSDYLNSSPLFKTRLSGPKNTIREFWGLPPVHDGQGEEFWSNHILICPVSRVRSAIAEEPHVYIPLINTPEEVIIAGETQACQRVIERLSCDAFPIFHNHVIHCPPMRSEYEELVRVNTLPLQDNANSDRIFYTAAEYAPVILDSQKIGHNIAQGLCQQLDFPQLVNRVYNDKIKIFMEVGVGSNCSRWISEILKEKEHMVVSVNRRGVDEHTSIIRALGKLLSHRVELDLSPLYSPPKNHQSDPKTSLISPVSLGEQKKHPLVNHSHHHSFKLDNSHRQKLSENNINMTKVHGFFLKLRQESLQKANLLLQEQIDFYKNTLGQEKN